MIVDFHTHIFPPAVAANRDAYLRSDPTFAAMYADPKAMLASADDLLASMGKAGIDVSVAAGFAWRDPDTCRLHNDYLLESAGKSDGRIVALCTLPLASGHEAIEAEARRCMQAGARGFGELRPDDLDFDLTGTPGDELATVAAELDAVLLFHVTEPVGHTYPGKQGLSLSSFYTFASTHWPEVDIIGAHWGGGLPFFSLMPEVDEVFLRINVDTAASSLLYGDGVYKRIYDLGSTSILFGSDFPLLSQARSKHRIEEALVDDHDGCLERILGGNAAKLLGLG